MESKKDERKESNTQKTKKTGSTTKKTQSTAQKTGSTTKKAQSTTKTSKSTTTKTRSNIEKAESANKKTQSKVEKKDTNIKDESKIENTARPQTQRKTGNRFLSFIWNILVKLVTIAIIFISIIIVVQKVTNNQEAFLGFRIFRVQTGSMIPTYQVGDVILVKEVNPDTIQIGDDVTYQGKVGSMKGMLVTHRVIDIEEVDGKRVFHTKGIANNSEDPVVSEEQINGVVQTKMYILSLICMLLNNKYVFYFCGILPLTIYVAFRLFKGKKVKRIEREN